MTSRGRARRTTGVVVALLVAGLTGTASAETVAGNDEITGATPISVPGGVQDQDTSGATAAANDPQSCWDGGYTVWFRTVAPETGVLRTDASASIVTSEGGPFDLSAVLAVFTGEPGALTEVGCWEPRFRESARVEAPVQAGDVIYIVAGGLQTNSAGTALSLDVGYLRVRAATVDDVATIGSDGAVTVTGTMRCDVDLTAQVSLSLQQPARDPLVGEALVGCSPHGVSTWSLTLTLAADEGAAPVHPGRVEVTGAVTAVGDSSSVPVSTSVVLRPAHPTLG